MIKLALALIIICSASVAASAQSYTSKAALAAAVEEVVQTPQKPSYSLPKQPRTVGTADDVVLWSGFAHDEISTAVKIGQGCREAGIVKNRATAAAAKAGFAATWEVIEWKNPQFAQSTGNKVFKHVAGGVFHAVAGWNWSRKCR